MPVLLIATLDTKGEELAFVRDRLRHRGLATLVLDAGSGGAPAIAADIPRERVFEAGGTSLEKVCSHGDRGQAVAAAARGAELLTLDLLRVGRIEGILALGGSAGTTIGTAAMRSAPFGLPKVMVTTLASGATRGYVGGSDLTLFPSVADLAGLNRLTRTVLTSAADALAGMIQGRREAHEEPNAPGPVVAATMFGVTTQGVTCARRVLEDHGCEVIVFHATGVGGQAMERLIAEGRVDGVLDLTTTELADELVGGILSAGPDRLAAAARRGVPQVVSLGALDMVNFGPPETVPERFAGRVFHHHNPNATLMRTTAAENERLGSQIASRLAASRGPVTLMIPRGGISAIDRPGQPFHDPAADRALFSTLETHLAGKSQVRVISREDSINDSAFAAAAARELLRMLGMARVSP